MKRALMEKLLNADCADRVVGFLRRHPTAIMIERLRFEEETVEGARTCCHGCHRLIGGYFVRYSSTRLCTRCYSAFRFRVLSGINFRNGRLP
jgi:hypothetical protein